jgi:lipopolysaccharide export system protein LptA
MKKFVAALLLLSAAPGFAADNAFGINPGANIAVNADSFVADLNQETGTWTGNVVVVQGDVRMRADEVRVQAPGGNASRMEARGNVVVDSPSGTARGTSAVYEVPAQIIRLAGPVVLTKDNNIMRGAALTVNVGTGVAQITGGTTATGQPQQPGTGRVQGLFVPQQAAPQAPQTPAQPQGNP